MFTNPAADQSRQRSLEQRQREQVHATADALYRACADSTDADTIEVLLCQLATLTGQPRHTEHA